EQPLLGGEQPEQIRLANPGAPRHVLGRGARQAAEGELGDRRFEHHLAALRGGHPHSRPCHTHEVSNYSLPLSTPSSQHIHPRSHPTHCRPPPGPPPVRPRARAPPPTPPPTPQASVTPQGPPPYARWRSCPAPSPHPDAAGEGDPPGSAPPVCRGRSVARASPPPRRLGPD